MGGGGKQVDKERVQGRHTFLSFFSRLLFFKFNSDKERCVGRQIFCFYHSSHRLFFKFNCVTLNSKISCSFHTFSLLIFSLPPPPSFHSHSQYESLHE